MSGLPLEGMKVLDLSRLLPGGFCSLLLADFGAEVLKVEDTGMGDYVRWATPKYQGVEDSSASALFLALNRNKTSIRIDLKTEQGMDVLLRLARDYDVLLESFRPGVLDRLGCGYEALRAVNPGLVYCAISGYGQDSPLRDRSGHDLNYLALSGLLGLTGDRDGAPVQPAGQIADLGGGALMAAFGILAALRERDRSGEGQLVDVSMTDGTLSWLTMVAARFLADGGVPRRGTTSSARYRAATMASHDSEPSAIETSTSCPSPLRSRSRRAARIPNAAISAPPPMSAIWPAGWTGGPSRSPVRPSSPTRPR